MIDDIKIFEINDFKNVDIIKGNFFNIKLSKNDFSFIFPNYTDHNNETNLFLDFECNLE